MSKLLISQYHNEVEKIKRYGGSKNESSIRVAFQNLLNNYCQTRNFLLIPELPYKNQRITPDGTIKDALQLDWGYWESKDENDDLDLEIEKKFAKGYPNDNILFEDSITAILIQSGQEKMRVSMQDINALDKILKEFIDYQRPEVAEFYQAITKFKEDLPTLINTLRENIDLASKNNQQFIAKRDTFLSLCQNSINPNISIEDIREMMIQHILTEDIFLTIFDEAQFHRDNNIARELTNLIDSFLKGGERKKLLSSIQHYYKAIKSKASQINNHHEKQKFLKAIYENFYKAYNPLLADRLGIVYTPNEIVKFMIESTDFLLQKHFNKLLIDKDVEILDPATGTGTFITELIEYLPINSQNCDALRYKYQHEIHCNEIAILPYYIANLNIEYTYLQKTEEYQEFNNICFVDTLDHTSFEGKQMDLFAMSLENTARIRRQNEKKISVIIGNPPYNAKQENFNDNNANRSYESIDKRIKSSYIKEGKAQNQIVLYDMYVRFIRWASDRLKDNGIIAFITNNSFIDGLTFDGFRKVLSEEFSHIYIIDLGGNIRQGDKTGNVFNIMIGVAITFLVRKNNLGVEYNSTQITSNNCEIYYYKSIENSGRDKLDFINNRKLKEINFTHIIPKNNNWINQSDNDFDDLLPLIDKEVKSGKSEEAIFKLFSRGITTQRDEWVYDINKHNLIAKVEYLIDIYEQTLQNNNFKDRNSIKWDRELTKYLERRIEKEFNNEQILLSLYRPFTKQYFYFDKHFNGMTYQWFNIYNQQDNDNKYISISGLGSSRPFHCLAHNKIVSLDFLEKTQCLPLYTYDKEGKREENITDWALAKFRQYYSVKQPSRLSDRQDACFTRVEEKDIEKIDIFYYVYAVLHNPKYIEKYELNLKREFPRIPFYNSFYQWVNWGKMLMNLHLNYSSIEPYNLKRIEILKAPKSPKLGAGGQVEAPKSPTLGTFQPHSSPPKLGAGGQSEAPKSPTLGTFQPHSSPPELGVGGQSEAPKSPELRVGGQVEGKIKVKLKADKIKHQIIIDEVTTLTEIPAEAWEYKLGNRSALEWILDQYKEKKSKDKTIEQKFNNYRFADYKEGVIELLKRVTTVSVETMKIIKEMENI